MTTIGSLKAYDPSSGMRTVFAGKTKDDRVTVAEGTFERVDAEDSWADLVIIAQVSPFQSLARKPRIERCGQAFHWCPDFDKAAREFARVLKPQGTLAFIWNLEDRYVAHIQSNLS